MLRIFIATALFGGVLGLSTVQVEAQPPEPYNPRVIIIGDSYISGEGSGSDGTYDLDPGRCHRSSNAWALAVVSDLGLKVDRDADFRACSGAEIVHLISGDYPSEGSPPQIDKEIQNDVRLVLLSIGGNDPEVKFGSVVTACIFGNCVDDLANDFKPAQLKISYANLYDRIAEQYPNALIVHTSYPELVPRPGEPYERLEQRLICNGFVLEREVGPGGRTRSVYRPVNNFDDAEREAVANASVEIKRAIEGAAQESTFRNPMLPVDTLAALDGHELCTSSPWLTGIFPLNRRDYPGETVRQTAVHPNVDGQTAYRTTVLPEVIAGLGSISGVVWRDGDNDNLRGAADPPVEGVEVRLVDITLGEPGVEVAEPIVTNADGQYEFGNLLPGTYLLEVQDPSGDGFVQPDAGDDSRDSDVDDAGKVEIELFRKSEGFGVDQLENVDAGLTLDDDDDGGGGDGDGGDGGGGGGGGGDGGGGGGDGGGCDRNNLDPDEVYVDGVCYPAFVPIIGWRTSPDDSIIHGSVEAACEYQRTYYEPNSTPLSPYPSEFTEWSSWWCDWEGGLINPGLTFATCPSSPALYIVSDSRLVAGPESGPYAVDTCESDYYDIQHPQ